MVQMIMMRKPMIINNLCLSMIDQPLTPSGLLNGDFSFPKQ